MIYDNCSAFEFLLLNIRVIDMIQMPSFSKSESVLGNRDCETYVESYFFSLAFLEPILKYHNGLRIDMKDVVCRSLFLPTYQN